MRMPMSRKPNRLAGEKSPYLLQHAYNPVDWYPWGDEAFQKAAAENKPVFLSVGYSTCHWCHVMERESFEDEEVAELLNRHFVAVKVDREERPDVDHVYMTVCQAMTGQGGWPLTVVMTPDKKPFFAGTYFPKRRKYGRPGLMDILEQIARQWNEDAGRIIEAGERIAREIAEQMETAPRGSVTAAMLDEAFRLLERSFDPVYGGFGGAPKFPIPHNVCFLLRYYDRTGKEKALEMAETTLDAMRRGGIYDHVGFGFARYSVDERWLVPHFEKMLYDNALLAWAYVEAYQVTGKRKYADTAEQIFAYVLRDMTDPKGGFYSAEDADSEGEEGKFYVWTPEEAKEALGSDDAELYCEIYDITEKGNFEGRSIPNLIRGDIEEWAKRKGMASAELHERLEACRRRLFAVRKRRVPPGKDDKILTAWNGLMIMALAKGYKVLGKTEYLEAAQRAADFLWTNLRREDGRLFARYRDGEAAYPAYVDDYAFFVWGLLELYEASFDTGTLARAFELNRQMLDLFWDETSGGLYFYGKDGEELFVRNKEVYDGAMPSGNSVAACNLLKIARLSSDAELSRIAERQLEAFAGTVERYPAGYAMMMIALDSAFRPAGEIVIAGSAHDAAAHKMIETVRSGFRPHAAVLFAQDGAEGERLRALVPAVGDKRPLDGKATAYVCENFSCRAPVTDVDELARLLQDRRAVR